VWLTAQQCKTLAKQLPQHIRAPTIFSVLTGLRMANGGDLT
jgi:hypothetical protein